MAHDPNDNPLRRPEHSDELRGNLVGGAAGAGGAEGGVRKVGFDDPDLLIPADRLHYHVPHPDARPEQHEHSDVPIRPLVIALAGIAGLLVFSAVFLIFLFNRYERQQESMEVPRTGVTNVEGQSVVRPDVPEPRLEGIPGYSNAPYTQELTKLRERHDAELNGWGRSEADGYARIPIDQAMDLAIERGMFKTTPAQGQVAGTTGPQQQQQQKPQQPAAGQPAPGQPASDQPASGQPPRSPKREEGVR